MSSRHNILKRDTNSFVERVERTGFSCKTNAIEHSQCSLTLATNHSMHIYDGFLNLIALPGWLERFVVARQLFSRDEIDHIRATFMDLSKDGPVENLSELQHGGIMGGARANSRSSTSRSSRRPVLYLGAIKSEARSSACSMSKNWRSC